MKGFMGTLYFQKAGEACTPFSPLLVIGLMMQRPKLIWINNKKEVTFGSFQQKSVLLSEENKRHLPLFSRGQEWECMLLGDERGSQCVVKTHTYQGDVSEHRKREQSSSYSRHATYTKLPFRYQCYSWFKAIRARSLKAEAKNILTHNLILMATPRGTD